MDELPGHTTDPECSCEGYTRTSGNSNENSQSEDGSGREQASVSFDPVTEDLQGMNAAAQTTVVNAENENEQAVAWEQAAAAHRQADALERQAQAIEESKKLAAAQLKVQQDLLSAMNAVVRGVSAIESRILSNQEQTERLVVALNKK